MRGPRRQRGVGRRAPTRSGSRVLPELGHIGPFTLYSFGLMAALGLIIPAWFLAKDLSQRGLDTAFAYEILLAAGIGGFVGARLYYVIENGTGDGLFSTSGLTWYGGLLGGIAAVSLLGLWRRKPLGVVANLVAPGVALGQGIGRIGCQLAGDGDYGSPTSLPWGMSYPDGTVPTTEIVHPTPIYESATLLVIFYVLWRLRGRLAGPWQLAGAYLVMAGTMRFLVEFVRRNPTEVAGLTTAQIISAVSVAVGAALLLRRRRAPVVV